MGFVRMAGSIALGVIAVKAAQATLASRDPGEFLTGAVITGLTGAAACSLIAQEIDEREIKDTPKKVTKLIS